MRTRLGSPWLALVLGAALAAPRGARAQEPAATPEAPPPRGGEGSAAAAAPAEPAPGGDSSAGAAAALAAESPPAGSGGAAAEAAAPPEISVAGTRVSQTAGSVQVINNKTLERFEYDDAHAIVQKVPGVYVRPEDGFGLRPNIGMRGAASDRSKKVTLMEDGVLVSPAPYSAPAAYYFPIMTRMTQVRVIKGPGAIAFGPQTIGGAIDFVSRPIPTESSGQIDLAGGQYAYGKFHGHAGTSTEDMGFLVEGVHLRTDGFKQLPGGEDTGFYRNEWVLKATRPIDPTARRRNDLTFKAMYSDELSNETYLGLSDADFRANPLQRYGVSKLDQMKWHRTAFSVTHRVEPVKGLQIDTTVYRNDLSRIWRKVNHFANADLLNVLRDPDNPSNVVFAGILRGELDSSNANEAIFIGPNARDFVSQGIQTRATWSASTGPLQHRLEYGLRLHYDRIERHHTEDAFLSIGGALIPTGAATTTTAWNEASTQAVAFHAADAISYGRLTLTPGVRAELMRSAFIDHLARSRQNGATGVVLPGAGAYYGFTDTFGALAGVYRGFSPPSPGSGNVKPELSVNYEGGVRYSKEAAHAELIGFYNDYSNLVDVCTLSSSCVDASLDRQYDAGHARIYGLEIYAAHDVPAGAVTLPLSLAYTLTRTEFLRDFSSEDPIFGAVHRGDEMPYVPEHQLNASVGVQTARAGAYVSGTYTSRMREQAGKEPIGQVMATDALYLFDVGASYRPLAWLEIYANVRNLLDSEFIVSRRPFGARPNAPRWAQLGVKARF